jgi:chorismate dehydratase
MIRIGEISYLNCTPIFTLLRENYSDADYHFIEGTPAELNARLRSGDIDLCPSSSIEYARNPELYFILPDLSISAVGPVKSVLLFSRVPIERLDGAPVGLTVESETSVALLRILLSRRYSFNNTFNKSSGTLDEVLAENEAMLLIGDAALRSAVSYRNGYLYDLGDLWREFTGLPFVFALWLLRADAFDRSSADYYLLRNRLIASKHAAVNDFERIAGLLKGNNWTNRELLINYWKTISYDLSPDHVDGLKLYFRYAAECGIIANEPMLRFLD